MRVLREVKRRAQGELVPTSDVERLRDEQARREARLKKGSTEKQAEIAVLQRELTAAKEELAEARAHNRWSPSYQWLRLRRGAVRRLRTAWSWAATAPSPAWGRGPRRGGRDH